MSKRVFVLFGTRPEAIKLFPVVKELRAHSAAEAIVCVTAQHREMLDQVLKLVNIIPDIDLDLMEKNQSLDTLSARILLSVGEALDRTRPDRVVVQGDTATAMIGSLAAYYRRIPVSHVEAGLRSGSNCQLPTAHCQLQTADCQLPTANCTHPAFPRDYLP